jgi:hypothetical protein
MFGARLASYLFAALLTAGTASAQPEFSAEIVDLHQAGTPTLAKVYFANDKKRIEMQDGSGSS